MFPDTSNCSHLVRRPVMIIVTLRKPVMIARTLFAECCFAAFVPPGYQYLGRVDRTVKNSQRFY